MGERGSMNPVGGIVMANWYQFESRDDMVVALKSVISARLSAATASGRRASWAVSGGSTPTPLFEAMQSELLAWQNIDVALVDERWVPFDHPRSNEAFVTRALKRGAAAAVKITGMKTDDATAAQAVEAVNKRYSALAQPFDSVLLGVGADGHTASLFPEAAGLEAAFDAKADTCVALTAVRSEVTGDEIERVSLSANAIACSPHVAVMITGNAKKQMLEAALKPNSGLPVGRLHTVKPFDVYWAP